MERIKSKKYFIILFAFLSIIWLVGCSKSNIVESDDNLTDKQALEKILEDDESAASFEPNYNEEEAMDFILGKTTTLIYPIKVGQRMILISKNLNIQQIGDSAIGTLTKTYDGILFIAASFDPSKPQVDSVFKKSFSTTITRKIIFKKIASTKRKLDNWKIEAISLPEGGTLTSNIEITKLTITLSGGEILEITSPNEYFLFRSPGKWKQLPVLNRGESTKVKVEVKSAYADTDFVTLTYGADKKGLHRSKRKFELISQSFDGQFYNKVYEQTYTTHQWVGHYHAIINAMPKQVIYDDTTPVESNSWGLPYFVR
jgi:hypothetical protein